MKHSLPKPNQTWAHAVSSKVELENALNDPNITAIESDILMGHKISPTSSPSTTRSSDTIQPIMAHPPNKTSDINITDFFQMTICGAISESQTKEGDLQQHNKHLKLDFKEKETVDSVLALLNDSLERHHDNLSDNMIFLNADIIHGPGQRNEDIVINPDEFIGKCKSFMTRNKLNAERSAFSLGWKVDCRSLRPYNMTDMYNMEQLILKYDLVTNGRGLVLAVNARVVYMDPSCFDYLLENYPTIQLLAWTGSGEPPISASRIDSINRHFQSSGYLDRIGFDCQIAKSYLGGLFYDVAVKVIAIPWNFLNSFNL